MAKWTMTEEQKQYRLLSIEGKIEIFWSQVDRSGGSDACWPWLGKQESRGRGYGLFYLFGESMAYRVAYLLVKGSIAPGMRLLHSCDNPPCCNPGHLSEGTHLENMLDKIAKGRQWRGGPKKRQRPTENSENQRR